MTLPRCEHSLQRCCSQTYQSWQALTVAPSPAIYTCLLGSTDAVVSCLVGMWYPGLPWFLRCSIYLLRCTTQPRLQLHAQRTLAAIPLTRQKAYESHCTVCCSTAVAQSKMFQAFGVLLGEFSGRLCYIPSCREWRCENM